MSVIFDTAQEQFQKKHEPFISAEVKRAVAWIMENKNDPNLSDNHFQVLLEMALEELVRLKNDAASLHPLMLKGFEQFFERLSPDDLDEMAKLYIEGSKLSAVKYVKEISKLGLKESKDFTEAYMEIKHKT